MREAFECREILMIEDELVAVRADLLRFARLQLRDADVAEDVVHDAIEAALANTASFAGRASVKTWVFAILKNKIIDSLRSSKRTRPFSSMADEEPDWEQQLDRLFSESGHWRIEMRPTRWPNPEESLAIRDFWVSFEACLDHLPESAARVFMMREFLGLDAREICSHLGLTTSNCHVILHRTRLRLRTCLETGWARTGGAPC